MKASSAVLLSALLAGVTAAPRNFSTIQPTGTYNPAAATAVQTTYPKDHHIAKGRYCDHIWHIVLDSADFEEAAANSDLQALAKYGVTLTNYYALTHPAQPNYLAMVAGDDFGLNEDRFVSLPRNVSTIVESLEAQKVLWAQYMEDQPFTAYTGWEYPAEDPLYSRAKNPLIAFDSIASENHRMVNLRSLASLQNDEEAKRMPQWTIIRPNLQHDGSTTDLDTAAAWVRSFLEPYVTEKKHYHRKLFIVTFAHAKTEDAPNRVFTLLLGDMHENERGTVDDLYYDHYSLLATTQDNWDLPNLGRFDCDANVFRLITHKAHRWTNKQHDIEGNYNSERHTGFLSDDQIPLPIPNLNCRGAGRVGVIKRVKKIWKKASYSYFDWVVNY